MSMRDWAVFDMGLVLTSYEFMELLKTYNGKIEDLPKEEIDEIIECADWSELNELTYAEFSDFEMTPQLDGDFKNLKDNYSCDFYEEDIYVLGLQKFNHYNNSALYTKYENEEEIYEEIRKSLENLGLKADMDFITKHTGRVWGTYFG